MVKKWSLHDPGSVIVESEKNWTSKADSNVMGYYESQWSPTNPPGDGRFGVCYVHNWNPLPIPWPGGGNTSFNFEFEASEPMMLTGWKCDARHDWVIYIASSGARLYVKVDTGYGFRAKRGIDPAHPLRDYVEINLGPGGAWVLNDIPFLHPLHIPSGAKVRFELHLSVATGDLPLTSASVRVGSCYISYRSKVNLSLTLAAKSWLSSVRKILPEDAMTVFVQAQDSEYGTNIVGYPVVGFHGPVKPPLNGMGKILTVKGSAPFPAFTVANPGVSEWIHNIQLTSEGFADQIPHDDYLGIGVTYADHADTDDANYRNSITISALADNFNVRKRTPQVFFDTLPSRLNLGDPTDFSGYLVDPDQPEMLDFLKDIDVRIVRDTIGLESRAVRSDGAFIIPRTLSSDDLGVNRSYHISSASSTQYNSSNSAPQSRTVWQIIQTSMRLLLDGRPPFLGTRFNVTARLAEITGTPVSGFDVKIFLNDQLWESGATDQLGEFTRPKLLDTVGQVSFQSMFSGAVVDGYKEYQASTSEVSPIDAVKRTLNTIISRFELERPDLLKGELATFHISLTDESGTPIGPTVLSLQRQVGTDWITVKEVEIDQYGNGTATWDASDLLGSAKSVTITTRAAYDGGEDTSLEPWEFYNPSESTLRNLTISALDPLLGHLMLRCKLDYINFEELPGTKSVIFTIDPPDTSNNTTFDRPQTVTVNPGRYNVECSLTVEDTTFTKNDSRDVEANEDVLVEFSFISSGGDGKGTGRLNVSIKSSRTVVTVGESFEVSGTVTLPTKLRSIPVRRVAVRIKSNNKTLASPRTDGKGNYSATISLDTSGRIPIVAEITGPLGNINIAKSPTIKVTVV